MTPGKWRCGQLGASFWVKLLRQYSGRLFVLNYPRKYLAYAIEVLIFPGSGDQIFGVPQRGYNPRISG